MATSMSADTVAQLRSKRAANEEAIQQLIAANAGIDRAIAVHEGAAEKATSFRFLDLPAELRDGIYDLCVAVGKVFLPPFLAGDVRLEGRHKYEKPQWQLLCVGKQVRKEAAKRLFSCNLIVLSGAFGSKDDTVRNIWMHAGSSSSRLPAARPLRFHDLRRIFLTRVSIALDIRAVDGLQNAIIRDRFSTGNPVVPDKNRDLATSRIWTSMLDCSISSNLRHLQVDLTNCYGAWSPHRQTSAAAELLHRRDLSLLSLPITLELIEILGTQTAAERRELTGALNFERQFGRFLPEYEFDRAWDGRPPETIEHDKLTVRFKSFKVPTDFSSCAFRPDQDFYRHEDLGDEEIEYGPPTLCINRYSRWYQRAPVHQSDLPETEC